MHRRFTQVSLLKQVSSKKINFEMSKKQVKKYNLRSHCGTPKSHHKYLKKIPQSFYDI